MAANYWASTQRLHWLFSREKLAELRQKLEDQDKNLVSQYPLPDRRLVNIYINQRKCRIGQDMWKLPLMKNDRNHKTRQANANQTTSFGDCAGIC